MNESWFYTNTFAVKDREAFQAFCETHDLNVMEENELVGCYSSICGLPEVFPGNDDEVVFLKELATYLQEGHVAIVVDAYITEREYSDASWQITYAVNAHGDTRILNHVDIFEDARELGQYIASLQDMCLTGTKGRIRRRSLPPHPQPHLLLPRGEAEVLASVLCALLQRTLHQRRLGSPTRAFGALLQKVLHPRRLEPPAWSSSERACLVQLAWMVGKYGLTLAGITEELRQEIRQAMIIAASVHADGFQTFSTRCPYCGNHDLHVVSVTLSATEEGLQVDIPLHSDGFDFSESTESADGCDDSTEDERVRCCSCGTEFELCDLLYE